MKKKRKTAATATK